MEIYDSEEQQVEAIKQWVRKNGLPVLLTLAISITGVMAWKSWTNSKNEQQEAASVIYQDMMDALVLVEKAPAAETDKQLTTLQHLANRLIEEYPRLQYAHFAALALAKAAVAKGDLTAAEKQLQWVLAQNADKPLANVATVRLARVMAAQGHYDEALKNLETLTDTSFQVLVEEVKGDIYLQKGDKNAARLAYQHSMELASTQNKQSDALVQMKLDDLAVAKD
jgi:predicted negative regulator of RcsB-dependent stress response